MSYKETQLSTISQGKIDLQHADECYKMIAKIRYESEQMGNWIEECHIECDMMKLKDHHHENLIRIQWNSLI